MKLKHYILLICLFILGVQISSAQVSDSAWFTLLDGEYGGALSNVSKYDNNIKQFISDTVDNNLKITIDVKHNRMLVQTSSETFEFILEGTKKQEKIRGAIPVSIYGSKLNGNYTNIYVNTETKSKPIISFLHPKTNIQYIFQFYVF